MIKLLKLNQGRQSSSLSHVVKKSNKGTQISLQCLNRPKPLYYNSQIYFKNYYCYVEDRRDYGGIFRLRDQAEENILLIFGSIFLMISFYFRYLDSKKPKGIKHIEKYKKEKDPIQKLEYAYDLIELSKSFTLEELEHLESQIEQNNFLLLSIIQSQIAVELLASRKKGGNFITINEKENNLDLLIEGEDYVLKSLKNLSQVVELNKQDDYKNLDNLSKKNKQIHEILTRIIIDVLMNLKCTTDKKLKNSFLQIIKENFRYYPSLAYRLKDFYKD